MVYIAGLTDGAVAAVRGQRALRFCEEHESMLQAKLAESRVDFKPEPPVRDVPCTREGIMFTCCRKCFEEKPKETSMEEWSKLNVAFTEIGLQVWCLRHDMNVVHIDFQGFTHPANMGAADGK